MGACLSTPVKEQENPAIGQNGVFESAGLTRTSSPQLKDLQGLIGQYGATDALGAVENKLATGIDPASGLPVGPSNPLTKREPCNVQLSMPSYGALPPGTNVNLVGIHILSTCVVLTVHWP